jgi:O-antigen/teichoic acid export membrane protein
MSRTKKGVLNVVSALLDQTLGVVTNLLITPAILAGIGPAAFGFWEYARRNATQLGMLDGRSAEVLKWKLAASSETSSAQERQQDFGAAFVSFLCFLPLLLVGFAVFIWMAPSLEAARGLSPRLVRWVTALLAVNVLIVAVTAFWQGILRGMNLSYKRMGLRGLITIAGGVASWLTVTRGGGLLQLSFILIATSIVNGISLYVVLRRTFSWFGLARPSRANLYSTFRQSAWFSVWEFIKTALGSADILLAGLMLGSAAITDYTVCRYFSLLIPVFSFTAFSAILPGIASEIGKKNMARVLELYTEASAVGCWIGLAFCIPALFLNQAFVTLWVGPEHYLGPAANFLIAITTYQAFLIGQDNAFLDILLSMREKIMMSVLSLVIFVFVSIATAPSHGILGVCLALFVSRLFLQFVNPMIIARGVNATPGCARALRWRPVVPFIILSAVALLQMKVPMPASWLTGAMAGAAAFIFALIVTLPFCVDRRHRSRLRQRIRALVGF